jgi:hypothetical protein
VIKCHNSIISDKYQEKEIMDEILIRNFVDKRIFPITHESVFVSSNKKVRILGSKREKT